MTKAERIYYATKRAVTNLMPVVDGDTTNHSLRGMVYENTEVFYKRTYNDIKKLLDRDIWLNGLDLKLRTITAEEYKERERIYTMLSNTLEKELSII